MSDFKSEFIYKFAIVLIDKHYYKICIELTLTYSSFRGDNDILLFKSWVISDWFKIKLSFRGFVRRPYFFSPKTYFGDISLTIKKIKIKYQ